MSSNSGVDIPFQGLMGHITSPTPQLDWGGGMALALARAQKTLSQQSSNLAVVHENRSKTVVALKTLFTLRAQLVGLAKLTGVTPSLSPTLKQLMDSVDAAITAQSALSFALGLGPGVDFTQDPSQYTPDLDYGSSPALGSNVGCSLNQTLMQTIATLFNGENKATPGRSIDLDAAAAQLAIDSNTSVDSPPPDTYVPQPVQDLYGVAGLDGRVYAGWRLNPSISNASDPSLDPQSLSRTYHIFVNGQLIGAVKTNQVRLVGVPNNQPFNLGVQEVNASGDVGPITEVALLAKRVDTVPPPDTLVTSSMRGEITIIWGVPFSRRITTVNPVGAGTLQTTNPLQISLTTLPFKTVPTTPPVPPDATFAPVPSQVPVPVVVVPAKIVNGVPYDKCGNPIIPVEQQVDLHPVFTPLQVIDQRSGQSLILTNQQVLNQDQTLQLDAGLNQGKDILPGDIMSVQHHLTLEADYQTAVKDVSSLLFMVMNPRLNTLFHMTRLLSVYNATKNQSFSLTGMPPLNPNGRTFQLDPAHNAVPLASLELTDEIWSEYEWMVADDVANFYLSVQDALGVWSPDIPLGLSNIHVQSTDWSGLQGLATLMGHALLREDQFSLSFKLDDHLSLGDHLVDVYIGVDASMPAVPRWLSAGGWVNTMQLWHTQEANYSYILWKKTYHTDDPVVLGGNRPSSILVPNPDRVLPRDFPYGMYVVLVQGHNETPTQRVTFYDVQCSQPGGVYLQCRVKYGGQPYADDSATHWGLGSVALSGLPLQIGSSVNFRIKTETGDGAQSSPVPFSRVVVA